jgi:small-conductance mechanosensitive channel
MVETLQQAWATLRGNIAEFIAALPAVLFGFLVFLAFMWLAGFVRKQVVRVLTKMDRSETLRLLIGRVVRGLVIGVGVLVAMTVALPTFQPSELIQLLGIGGIAIGFAFQNIFENFLAGIILLIDQPFKIGDQVVAKGHEGTVEDIQLRATYIRTYDGRLVVIPNSDVFTDSVVVNTACKHRRSEYDIGIGYADDIEQAQMIMLEVMRETDGVLANPAPDTVMMEMGDSAIVIRARWWTKPRKADVLDTQNIVLRAIKNRLVAEGFNIPFPIRTVMFYDQSKDGIDGERVNQQRLNEVHMPSA